MSLPGLFRSAFLDLSVEISQARHNFSILQGVLLMFLGGGINGSGKPRELGGMVIISVDGD